jgi:Spy/CpxP family protein refolding chaperone
MKKIIVGILAVAVLASAAIFVFAQRAGHKGHGGFGRGPGIGMALRQLDLTDDQKAKVKAIFESSKANVQPLMLQLRDNHKSLAALGTDGTFDQAKTEALANEQAAIMSKLIVEREKAKAQVFALLTDAQKAKAADLRQKFQERMKNRGPLGEKPGEGSEL